MRFGRLAGTLGVVRARRVALPRGRGLPCLGALALAAIFSACERSKPEPEPRSAPAVASHELPPGHPPVAAGPAKPDDTLGLKWTDPPAWSRIAPSSPMRKASYVVPRAAGDPEDAEMAVFFFGSGMGGSTEDNVKRWVGQFPDVPPGAVKRSDRSGGGVQQHLVEIERGTFNSGMPGGPTTPKKDFAMVGAIVDAPKGKVFFKLTGPAPTVAAARETFLKLLDGVVVVP